jgi:hypothetical protein
MRPAWGGSLLYFSANGCQGLILLSHPCPENILRRADLLAVLSPGKEFPTCKAEQTFQKTRRFFF